MNGGHGSTNGKGGTNGTIVLVISQSDEERDLIRRLGEAKRQAEQESAEDVAMLRKALFGVAVGFQRAMAARFTGRVHELDRIISTVLDRFGHGYLFHSLPVLSAIVARQPCTDERRVVHVRDPESDNRAERAAVGDG